MHYIIRKWCLFKRLYSFSSTIFPHSNAFDCISEQLHKQEKMFAPDEWSGSCGANVCVWETELSKACGTCSDQRRSLLCFVGGGTDFNQKLACVGFSWYLSWLHQWSVATTGKLCRALGAEHRSRESVNKVKKCIKGHKRMWKDCADVTSERTAAAQQQHSHLTISRTINQSIRNFLNHDKRRYVNQNQKWVLLLWQNAEQAGSTNN